MEMLWYALYTKPHFEKRVSDSLTKKGIENFFPVNKVLKTNGVSRLFDQPLFPANIFVKTSKRDFLEIKKINGILNFVYWLDNPVVISENEIIIMKRFLANHLNVKVEKMTLREDISKKVETSITFFEGNVMTIKNKKVNVVLPSLGYILMAEAETSNVRIISSESIVKGSNFMASKFLNPVVTFNNFLKD